MADDTHAPYDAGTPRDRELRVGDAEREAVAAALRREHVAGRLDDVEFDERLTRCLAAKTYAELDALLADLPRASDGRERRGHVLPVRFPLLAVVPLAVLAIVLSHGR